MKNAIITYTSAQNWGGQLQAYSLMEYMNQVGYDTDLINFRSLDGRKFKPKKEIKDILYSLMAVKANKLRIDRFNEFRTKYLKLKDPVLETDEDLSLLNEMYDVFITGSDQVWNCETKICYPFYLNFVNDSRRRVAYAPSFGGNSIPNQFSDEVRNLLAKYKHISVRESSGAAIVKQLINADVPVVVDPVFLHSASEWTEKLNIEKKEEKYVFVYTTERSGAITEAVRKFHRYHPEYSIVSAFAIPGVKARIVKDIGPVEFVDYVSNAGYVVANSFHAIAFSLIYQVPFSAILHSTRSARVVDLLSELDLQNRIFRSPNNHEFEMHLDIRYRDKLSEMIQDSKQYIDFMMR